MVAVGVERESFRGGCEGQWHPVALLARARLIVLITKAGVVACGAGKGVHQWVCWPLTHRMATWSQSLAAGQ